ncbi:MAG: hydantoinase/oxoprolinase family protein [Chromatiales bacterium]|jgi:N-methylhydantoinase A|nr:hydantoinase/oxoprolinase family protein [Chromatiales bacterium]MDX9766690.1 hydantoinase/oxoprolinase family protein [Ectothiorhodospiraceae bacterium]
MNLLGIDTGGTFTDFVLYDGHGFRVHKVLSTPDAPERAILQGIAEMGLDPGDLAVIHGSTVATNAVLEGRGVRTVYVANRGLADLLAIGRQARRALYDLQPPAGVPPVPAALCLETGGRLAADGSVVEPLTDEDLAALAAAVAALRPRAVAVNLLFSWRDDRFERAIGEALARLPQPPFLSLSSAVLPEMREYERGIATWLNAAVGPLMQGYLDRLHAALAPAPLSVMQSHGGTIDAAQAGRNAVRLLLSGPAGGLNGARHVAAAVGVTRLLSFDMGGTSTDVALIDGELRLTGEGEIAGLPVAVPMVDMHTIGAGGGSIAMVDAGGLLQVGPASAGADPGPACYGRGGERPTVTDANLILGRLPPQTRLAGGMALDPDAARRAMRQVAEPLDLTLEAAAEGVIRVVNEHMAAALRLISAARGHDPRGFALFPFGGAGGLHVCELAGTLGIERALVPVHGGVLSALGMLAAPRSRQLSHGLGRLLDDLDERAIEAVFASLIESGRPALRDEAAGEVRVESSVDLRYEGQSATLSLPWRGIARARDDFHARHEARFGHALDLPVELVNLRVGLSLPHAPPPIPPLPSRPATMPEGISEVHGVGSVPIVVRDRLAAGQVLDGPLLVTETVATTWVAPGWRMAVDAVGNLDLVRGEGSSDVISCTERRFLLPGGDGGPKGRMMGGI